MTDQHSISGQLGSSDQHSSSDQRVAIVTGGARGIGAAVGARLARDGMAVALIDLRQEDADASAAAITAAGGTAIGVAADVSDEASVKAAVETVVEKLGPPTVLINNAGILRDNLLFKMSVDDWDAVLGVHLRGAFLMSREVQKYQVEAKWGRIVNLSSSSALGNRGQANYSAAKAGMQGFTKTLAIELGPFGVTANAIAPGFIETAMIEETARRMKVSLDTFLEEAAKQIAVRRVGQPDDIAAAAAYFCSEEAGYVSGQVLYVAGGPLN
ncbi:MULTISPECIES: 3-oxoacyl-ACP reductase FabG [unclassified Frondihabitans]|uniref:3-oxoacyl-ACP reductase FabG n=1 Tax=unclassified Frondihabitans TaxID=2626248 RepID=UPI000F4FEAED|nr:MULTISPECIES: 3-oxoacyl-ACP reductase FabG [unclassified Frondihabitans]RPE74875.1 3-oxoacyl-[acyl-carrier protein] reductase [Frondihabitans sp. PhB153]RPF04119.1 3-oxoacyl-[acyl-carrier protein] reductase [Frondihabitans sp. PhB161]